MFAVGVADIVAAFEVDRIGATTSSRSQLTASSADASRTPKRKRTAELSALRKRQASSSQHQLRSDLSTANRERPLGAAIVVKPRNGLTDPVPVPEPVERHREYREQRRH